MPSDESTGMASSSPLAGSGNESDYDNNQSSNDYSDVPRYMSSLSRTSQIPVNDVNQSDELTRTDDLLLGDQNEIVLHNDSNIHSTISNPDDDDADEARVDLSDDHDDDHRLNAMQPTVGSHHQHHHPQSDTSAASSTSSFPTTSNPQLSTRPAAGDDSAPPNVIDFRKDPLAARKLFDIRSHLLLNTTLDAT